MVDDKLKRCCLLTYTLEGGDTYQDHEAGNELYFREPDNMLALSERIPFRAERFNPKSALPQRQKQQMKLTDILTMMAARVL